MLKPLCDTLDVTLNNHNKGTTTMSATLRSETFKLLTKCPGTVAAHDQLSMIMGNSTKTTEGLRLMIEGLETYVRAIDSEHGTKAGDDYYLAPYLKDIALSLVGLLSGPGKFDGGTCDGAIRAICSEANIELE